MEAGEVAPVEGQEVPPVRDGLPAHAVGGVLHLPPAPREALGVGEGDGGLQGGRQRRGRQDLAALPLPVVHEGRQPVGKVLDVGDDGAAGSDPHDVLVKGDAVEVARLPVLREGHPVVGGLLELGDGEAGALHAQGVQDPGLDQVLPGAPGLELQDLAHGGVHHVVVEEGLAQGFLGLHEADAVEELPAGEVGLVPDAVVAGDAGTVAEHVPQGDVGVQVIVVEADGGDGVADGAVPGELAVLHQHPRRHRGEELGVGRDLAHGGRGHGQLAVHVPVAIALGEDQLVPDHHAHGHARGVPVLEHLLHVGVEALEARGRVLLRTKGGNHEEAAEDGGDQGSGTHGSSLGWLGGMIALPGARLESSPRSIPEIS